MAGNYIDDLADEVGAAAPFGCPGGLLRLYALLALVKGTEVTPEDVHHAWSAWIASTRGDHPWLIPYAELTPEVQQIDAPWMAAIRQVAARLEAG